MNKQDNTICLLAAHFRRLIGPARKQNEMKQHGNILLLVDEEKRDLSSYVIKLISEELDVDIPLEGLE
jgi:hypothetical protein